MKILEGKSVFLVKEKDFVRAWLDLSRRGVIFTTSYVSVPGNEFIFALVPFNRLLRENGHSMSVYY